MISSSHMNPGKYVQNASSTNQKGQDIVKYVADVSKSTIIIVHGLLAVYKTYTYTSYISYIYR